MAIQPRLVFLGGTCGNNHWRDRYIDDAVALGIEPSAFFNPVVTNWNEEAQHNEEVAKATATELLFYLADPGENGNQLSAYSMVEATMALYDQPDRTIVVFDNDFMVGHAKKAMQQVQRVLHARFPKANIFTRDESLRWLLGSTVVV